jgi:PhoPQ-activated pathogenicity-related protein
MRSQKCEAVFLVRSKSREILPLLLPIVIAVRYAAGLRIFALTRGVAGRMLSGD